jgi:hypothetical protein
VAVVRGAAPPSPEQQRVIIFLVATVAVVVVLARAESIFRRIVVDTVFGVEEDAVDEPNPKYGKEIDQAKQSHQAPSGMRPHRCW